MTIGFIFWLLMFLWLIFGIINNWPGVPARPYAPLGNVALLFILFFLLGWACFGLAIQGPGAPMRP
jgi:hypothetical protein